MSVMEAAPKPIFGQITVEQMADNVPLARHVLGVVQKVCKHSKGRLDVESVAQGLRTGQMLLYGILCPPNAALEAAVVARVRDGAFEILIAGPHFEDVAPFMDGLEQIAKAKGCNRVALWGPPFFKAQLSASWFAREVRYECVLAD